MAFTAVGQLVFRLNGEELRLTAIGVEGQPYLAVWFKDKTNGFDHVPGLPLGEAAARQERRMDRARFQLCLQPAVRVFQLHHLSATAT